VAIAEKVAPKAGPAVAEAMEKVAKATANKALARKAASLAQQARRGGPRRR